MASKKKGTAAEPRKPVHGYDAAGHLNPEEAEHLLALGLKKRHADDAAAFVDGASTDDDLAEGLAEAAVTSMTTGEDELGAKLDQVVDEESGGPFTETSGSVEFAEGTDASNIAEATREPFPTANSVKNS